MPSKRTFFLLILLIGSLLVFDFYFNAFNESKLIKQKVVRIFSNLVVQQEQEEPMISEQERDLMFFSLTSPTSIPLPTLQPTKVPTPVDPYANDPDLKDAAWGEAVQVSETGYRMKVGFDSVMGTAQETFQALNLYRYTKGKSNLTWDDRLAKYALERATYVCKNGSDGHAGFSDYVENQKGYKTLGFYQLGENMSTKMRFTATHLIEWMYAADKPHDDNQLDNSWTHVGIGIDQVSSVLIFGKHKI